MARLRGEARGDLAGQRILAAGGSAVDAFEAAIRSMEADPVFNAEYCAVLDADGEVEMDASLVEGADFDIGGVAAIKGVRHPVTVARTMLRGQPNSSNMVFAYVDSDMAEPRCFLAKEQNLAVHA